MPETDARDLVQPEVEALIRTRLWPELQAMLASWHAPEIADQSIGRLMTPDYVAVRAEWTVKEAIQPIRARGSDGETIIRVPIVDADWRLFDDIAIRRFILADPEQRVEDLTDHASRLLGV